jgi:hypothetical protein
VLGGDLVIEFYPNTTKIAKLSGFQLTESQKVSSFGDGLTDEEGYYFSGQRLRTVIRLPRTV